MLNNSSAVLEVDVGNSFCKWRVRAGEAILCSGKAKTGELDTLFATAVGVGLSGAYVCSVAALGYNKLLTNKIKELWRLEPVFFKVHQDCAGLKNSYADPAKMGADRWLAAISAKHKYPGKALCIVDCGSAVNVEFVSVDAVHIGGYIMPGLGMMKAALLSDTAKVISACADNSIAPGVDTGTNVSNGCLFLLLSLIEKLHRQTLEKEGVLILTGGDVSDLLLHLDLPGLVYDRDLVLDGFKYIYPSR